MNFPLISVEYPVRVLPTSPCVRCLQRAHCIRKAPTEPIGFQLQILQVRLLPQCGGSSVPAITRPELTTLKSKETLILGLVMTLTGLLNGGQLAEQQHERTLILQRASQFADLL